MSEASPKDTKQLVQQLQMLEQAIQQFLAQKQQFNVQISEMETALKELESTDEAYKIVGGLLVKSNKDTISSELKDKKERTELRIRSIEKQENQLREKAKKLQSEIMEGLNRKENAD